MRAKRRILLCGNSVIMGTIGASLRRCSQFDLLTLVPKRQKAGDLDSLKPDMVLFDLEATRTENIFSLLRIRPNLVLIGISPDINLVRLWSGRQLRELSTQDLLEVINDEFIDSTGECESPDMASVDLSTGNEDTRALLDAFRSSSVPVRVCSANGHPETAENASTAEERRRITKSEARQVAHTLRNVLKGRKINSAVTLEPQSGFLNQGEHYGKYEKQRKE